MSIYTKQNYTQPNSETFPKTSSAPKATKMSSATLVGHQLQDNDERIAQLFKRVNSRKSSTASLPATTQPVTASIKADQPTLKSDASSPALELNRVLDEASLLQL
jgi:hypothetical protein